MVGAKQVSVLLPSFYPLPDQPPRNMTSKHPHLSSLQEQQQQQQLRVVDLICPLST